MLSGLRFQIYQIDIALLVTGDRYDREPSDHGAGRIGSMCRGRDQADIPLALSSIAMISADHHESGILTLRAGIGLQRDGGKAGDHLKPGLELRTEILIA